jgi:SHS2 domain-containing protein
MATRAPVEFAALDHTGDLGILVRAATPEELFERAAAAMFSLVGDPVSVGEELEETVRVEAEDRETLLVAWLSELLYRHVVHSRLYRLFEVSELGETRLEGRVRGEPLDESRHEVETELKAVTYHGLLVSEDREGWSARVIFDV